MKISEFILYTSLRIICKAVVGATLALLKIFHCIFLKIIKYVFEFKKKIPDSWLL
jgi:hypothetical protein